MSIANIESLRTVVASISPTARLGKILDQLTLIQKEIAVTSKSVADPKTRKRLEAFHNKTSSLRGGLESLDYTYMDVAQYRIKAMAALSDMVKSNRVSASKLNALANSEEAAGGSVIDRQSSDGKLNAIFKDYQPTMTRYASQASILQALNGKDFIIGKAPIIPMSKPILMHDKLKEAGFDVGKIGGYTVLEDQMVLGLNVSYVQKTLAELKNKSEQTAEMIVRQIEKKSGRKYEIIKGQPKGVGQWYWLIPSRDYTSIRKTSVGEQINIMNWGFAFS